MKTSILLFLAGFAAMAGHSAVPTARELGERYQRTRAEEDRLAWVTALDAEGWDFKQRARTPIDARGVYKFNRESKVLCVVLRKTDRPGDSWDEDVSPDGRIHFEWTRKPNGGIDYRYSAPTNWDVFVNAYPGAVTRYGAKVTKARLGKSDPMPEVSLPEGWRVVAGDEFSGVNVREAFFTFERDGTNLPPPQVSVKWGTVAIASVQGAKDVSVDGATARFTPTARKPPTGFSSSFPGFGPVSSSLSLHLEGMQAGPYKDYPFPSNEVKAVANFVFAMREGFRRIGFDRKEAFDGRIWLGGFDSNFPNCHTDFPPHFHLIPSARDGTQVHHFYVDPKDGRITSDCYQDMSRVMDVWDRVTTFRPGDTFPAFDGHGRVAFRVKLLPDGTGLEVAVEGNPQLFRVAGTRPCEAVDVLLTEADTWRVVKTITVRDDPVTGTMETPEGTIHYDPSTGAKR